MTALLSHALRQVWPRRAQQELLLDLGEHKGWGNEDMDGALANVAAWLSDSLLLPSSFSFQADRSSNPAEVEGPLRELGNTLGRGLPSAGVARWIAGLAPVVGSTPKTLANTVGGALQPHRPDHRWLAVISRILRGDTDTSVWSFHLRDPAVVSAELSRRAGRNDLDAGDATLLLSLLALWQRRRPTTAARSNRGRPLPRRITPKPIAGVLGSLLHPGQLRHVHQAARELGPEHGRSLLLLGMEAAFTEAHLAPHPAKRSGEPIQGSGESHLLAIEKELAGDDGLLDEADIAVLKFRVGRMRSWRDGTPQPEPPATAVRFPYVRASMTLENTRTSPQTGVVTFDPHTQGLLMLLPLLRSRGLLVPG